MQQLSNQPLPVDFTPPKAPYRVVLIHPSAGLNYSGTETFAIELSKHLSPYFEIELLSGAPCGSFSHPISSITRTQSYNILHHWLLKPFWSKFTRFPEIWIEHLTSFLPFALHLLRKPADLIVPCNEKGGLAIAVFVRKLIGTPILYTEHGSFIDNGRHLQQNLLFEPDHLVLLSEAVSKLVHTLRPEQATSIIPNGVDLNRFTPQGESINLGLSEPIVLCVATLGLSGIKRIELAIEAVARLKQGSLLICGQGPDRAYYQSLGDRLLGSKRFAIRTFPQDEMPKVYRSVDLFTLPSRDEPFGLAYIEAMASGVPVVATDDEMRRYIVADSGILCDVCDVEAYATSLKQALSRSWGTKPRQNALRFSWETISLQYRALIEAIIKQSKQA